MPPAKLIEAPLPEYVEADKQDAIDMLEEAIEMIKTGQADAALIGLLMNRGKYGDDSVISKFSTGCFGRLYKAAACADLMKDNIMERMKT